MAADGPEQAAAPDQPAAPPEQPAAPDQAAAPRSAMSAIAGEDFSLHDVIGGWRGLAESLAPGLVFVVVFIAVRSLPIALVASLAAAAVAVIGRLVSRTSLNGAISGLGGVVVGVVWAALSGRAQDYFAGGFIVNVGMLAIALGSILVRHPAIGYVYALFTGTSGWRRDPVLRRRATWATWPWVALPAARLLVQWPLYLDGTRALGWLGGARLAMGLPLTALAVYLSWLVLRRTTAAAAAPSPDPSR